MGFAVRFPDGEMAYEYGCDAIALAVRMLDGVEEYIDLVSDNKYDTESSSVSDVEETLSLYDLIQTWDETGKLTDPCYYREKTWDNHCLSYTNMGKFMRVRRVSLDEAVEKMCVHDIELNEFCDDPAKLRHNKVYQRRNNDGGESIKAYFDSFI